MLIRVFLGIFWKFSKQLYQYFHAVGTIEETDGLLKNLIRSPFTSSWGVRFEVFWYWKTIQNCIIVIFHLKCLTNSFFEPAGYNVGWHLLFHNWCRTIKWPFLFPVAKNATKMCVCVCVCVCVSVCACEKFHLCWK